LNPSFKNGKKTSAPTNQSDRRWPFGFSGDAWAKSTRKEDDKFASIKNQVLYELSDDEGSSGPPSTSSSLSLSRLRYTVLSIAALREASRIKLNPYSSYLSRATLAFTGQSVIGEGLDGCSRETLDVVLSFNPDSALLLDPSVIYEGLKCGRWRHTNTSSVMTSSLAVALTLPATGPTTSPLKMPSKEIHNKETFVSNALGILPPKSEELDSRSPLEGSGLPSSIFMNISRFVDLPPSLLRANRWACFLYNVSETSVYLSFEFGMTTNALHSFI
jgi:hypothetical protein